jgi:toxin HigB-1
VQRFSVLRLLWIDVGCNQGMIRVRNITGPEITGGFRPVNLRGWEIPFLNMENGELPLILSFLSGISFFTCFAIDIYKHFVYSQLMIVSFANKETEKLFATGKSKKLPTEIITRAIMRLTQLDNAREVSDLSMPPSNHLEALSGNRAGQWSIRINDQWRICFGFAKGEATDVEITDYH